jgi:hypothetical protein
MTQADDREAKESIVALLTILSERADLGAEVVQFLHSWIGGNTSLFVRSPSRRLVPADKVFLRRYDGESIA